MAKKNMSQTKAEEIFSELSWEHSIVEERKKSEARAWTIAKCSMGLAALVICAFLASMPFRTTVVRVVEIDKLTGDSSVIGDLPQYVASRNDVNDKHWLKTFVISHERYDIKILQRDFDVVKILSGDKVYERYKKMFVGPNAMQTKLADSVELIPTILSITLPSPNIATVRYEVKTTNLKNTGMPSETARYIATINYTYRPNVYAKERDLIDNPLGFYVDSYQVDPEVATSSVSASEAALPVAASVPVTAPAAAPGVAVVVAATPGQPFASPSVPAIGGKP